MSGGEMSGVDLARVALHAACQATKKHGVTEVCAPRRRRPGRTARRDGRDPQNFAAVLTTLMADRVR
jgi:hypothetical protein